MKIDDRMFRLWVSGASDQGLDAAVQEDLRDRASSQIIARLRKMNETARRLTEASRSGEMSWAPGAPDEVEAGPPQGGAAPDVAPDERSPEPPDFGDFVHREVLRLLNAIDNPSRLLDREDLRRFRDQVVERARASSLLTSAENQRELHLALARSIRPIRWENARVTSKSGYITPKQKKEADDLLVMLGAQDRVLAEFLADERFAHVALWYQLAEDAALSDDEIAALWGEDPAVVRRGLVDPRAEVLVEQRDPR